MADAPDRHTRAILPIPDVRSPGLTTYDAKDPATSFPPIVPLRPPGGAPNVLVVLVDDVGFGASSAFGGPCNTPTAERLAAGGLRYNRFHTTALCAPTRQALLTGRNHHSAGMGNITETATSAPGQSSLRPNTMAPLAQTLTLNGYSTAQFGKCHEVPVWQSSPMGPFDAWPSKGGGFEHFYGFIGGENNQWDPALYEGTTPIEPPATAGGGLPPHRRPHRPLRELDPPAEGAHARQALLHLLRTRRHPRPPPRRPRVDREVQGEVLPWLGRAARADLRPAEGARGDPRRCRAHPAQRPDHRLGRHARRAEAGPRARDGGVRRLPRAHRPQRRPDRRHPGGPRGPRRHDHLLHHRRQRRVGRGHHERRLQRDGQLQRHARARDARVHGQQARRVRLAELLQPLLGRLGVGDEHAVPVDEAGCLPLGRHPQRHDRALAQRDHRSRAGFARSSPTSSTSRPRSSRRPASRSRRSSTACSRPRSRARACCTPSTTGRRRSATTSSTSRCSATAASTTRGGAPSRSTRPPGSWSVNKCRPSTTTCGSSTTAPPATTASPATWPRSNPSGWPSCSGSGSSKPPSTTCSPSTTAPPSASTRTWPDDPR